MLESEVALCSRVVTLMPLGIAYVREMDTSNLSQQKS